MLTKNEIRALIKAAEQALTAEKDGWEPDLRWALVSAKVKLKEHLERRP